VWGYLVPLDGKSSQYDTLVLRERAACSKPMGAVDDKIKVPEKQSQEQEGNFEKGKVKNRPSQGYLIGRHPECGSLHVFPFYNDV
jgi:hypothetical protein